jgi:hypothetical protein
MMSSVPAGTSDGIGQRSPCGKRVGRSGSGGGGGGPGGFFFVSTAVAFFEALAESDDCAFASFLLSLDDPATAAFAAGAFLLVREEFRREVFEDVPQADASSKNAQLPSRQNRMVSFKPTMASLRMVDCDVVLPLSLPFPPPPRLNLVIAWAAGRLRRFRAPSREGIGTF